MLALTAPHYCFGKGNRLTPHPLKKTAYINLALEFKLPHIGFYLDFWFQGWASNRGNHIALNSYLQVDVKPTSPFIHPHTFSVLIFIYLFVDFDENRQELHALRAPHYCLVEKQPLQ